MIMTSLLILILELTKIHNVQFRVPINAYYGPSIIRAKDVYKVKHPSEISALNLSRSENSYYCLQSKLYEAIYSSYLHNRLCSFTDMTIAWKLFLIFMSERTSSGYIYYALKLYSSGLSLRKRSQQQLSLLIKRNHVSIWNWIQKYKSKKILQNKKKKIQEVIIDETLIKVNSNYVWI
jgi:hypothetical protein